MQKRLFDILDIKPIQLAGCEFINLKRYGLEYGTDCCPATEDETLECEDCEHSKLTPFYPELDNLCYLFMLSLIDIGSVLGKSVDEIKSNILSKTIESLEKDPLSADTKQLLVDFLLNNCYIQFRNLRYYQSKDK